MGQSLDKRSRILVVDDDADFRGGLVEWLEDSGYTVREAVNGKDAMQIASDESFDLVLTDLKMPEANGLELLEWLKLWNPGIAVIFLSGNASVQEVISALREWGGFDFLEKPVEMQALNAVIERAIARSTAAPAPAEEIPAEPLSPFSRRALQVISERYRESVSLSTLSQELGYSPAYLTDTLRRETGKTVLQWLIHYRMEEAKRLLSETDWTGQQIAQSVGYANYTHFVRQFRQLQGMAPSAWRSPTKSP